MAASVSVGRDYDKLFEMIASLDRKIQAIGEIVGGELGPTRRENPAAPTPPLLRQTLDRFMETCPEKLYVVTATLNKNIKDRTRETVARNAALPSRPELRPPRGDRSELEQSHGHWQKAPGIPGECPSEIFAWFLSLDGHLGTNIRKRPLRVLVQISTMGLVMGLPWDKLAAPPLCNWTSQLLPFTTDYTGLVPVTRVALDD